MNRHLAGAWVRLMLAQLFVFCVCALYLLFFFYFFMVDVEHVTCNLRLWARILNLRERAMPSSIERALSEKSEQRAYRTNTFFSCYCFVCILFDAIHILLFISFSFGRMCAERASACCVDGARVYVCVCCCFGVTMRYFVHGTVCLLFVDIDAVVDYCYCCILHYSRSNTVRSRSVLLYVANTHCVYVAYAY